MDNQAEPEINNLLTDYLIVGAGAMGLGFLDELINSSTDVEAIIVDTRSAPGGHWNDAYDFVRLHQPANTYGVNSRSLGSGNLWDLASKPEILEHFELALDTLVATGRVKWFPQCRYTGDGCFESVVDPRIKYSVRVQRKVVNATLTSGNIPVNTPPNYEVAEGVKLIPVNGLAKMREPWERYMVIGAGKTALDAILFMLERGVEAGRICWIISNDCWYFCREAFMKDQGSHFMKELFDSVLEESMTSPDQCLLDLEQRGLLMRLDKAITPTRYRAATVSIGEMGELGRVRKRVRMGRISRIEKDRVIFQSNQVDPFVLSKHSIFSRKSPRTLKPFTSTVLQQGSRWRRGRRFLTGRRSTFTGSSFLRLDTTLLSLRPLSSCTQSELLLSLKLLNMSQFWTSGLDL